MERLIIFAADKEGRIPVPKSGKNGLQSIRKALAQLKKRGLVCRETTWRPDSLPYMLTTEGRSCREYMISGTIQNEVDSMNWSSEEPGSHSSGLL